MKVWIVVADFQHDDSYIVGAYESQGRAQQARDEQVQASLASGVQVEGHELPDADDANWEVSYSIVERDVVV